MIRRLKIRDFQSLATASLELGRFTVLSGPSDIGKSAIVRAIRALVSNQSGGGFVRSGADRCGVSLDVGDGAVAWLKPVTGGAEYRLAQNGAQLTYTRVGRAVPLAVSELLKLDGVKVGDEVISPNIHQQFAPPFLLAETPALRARLLGELSGVNVLFLAISEARRQESQAKRLLAVREGDLATLRDRLASYTDLPAQQAQLHDLSTLLQRASEYQRHLDALRHYRDRSSRLESRVAQLVARSVALRQLWQGVDRQFLETQWASYVRRRDLLLAIGRADYACVQAREKIASLQTDRQQLAVQLAQVASCPLCGRVLPHPEAVHA